MRTFWSSIHTVFHELLFDNACNIGIVWNEHNNRTEWMDWASERGGRKRKTCMAWLTCAVMWTEDKISPLPFILFILWVCLFWLYWTESCTLFVFCSHFIRMQLTHHRITFVCNSRTRWLFSFVWPFKYFSFGLCRSPTRLGILFARCFALVLIQNIGVVILFPSPVQILLESML